MNPISRAAESQLLSGHRDGRDRRRSAGVTLVEMLVVLAIVLLIAAVGIGALILLPERARERGTEALVSKIDDKLNQRLGEFNRRRGNIRTLACDLYIAGNDANRAHVVAVIRTMRQELPELFTLDSTRTTDGVNNDGDTDASGNPLVDESDEIVSGQWNPVDLPGTTNDQALRDLPPSAVAIRNYFERIFSENSFFSTVHRPATARAECLYAVATAGGTDTEWIVPGETADTDEDGLLEFVDKWGNPLGFFLFPTHYTSPLQKPGQELNPNDTHQLLTENQNPMTSWWKNQRSAFENLFHSLTRKDASGNDLPQAYLTRPLIIAAGSDKGFGLEASTADVGEDGVMGTFDDTGALLSRASRITSTGQDGYGMDGDNIDNHHLRAR